MGKPTVAGTTRITVELILEKLAAGQTVDHILKSHPNLSVNVNGYCDAIGSVRYNLKLSERRSNAVVKYLGDHGIAEGRLSPHGYGKTDFVATNKTAEGRAQNRRVELVPNQ